MGRPSDMTKELTLQIRQLVLEGVKYKDIQEKLEILPGTWDKWHYEDYKDFRKNLQAWKVERLMRKTEKLSEDIIDMDHTVIKEDRQEINTELLRVKQKEAEFIRSTLGKDSGYSTKQTIDSNVNGGIVLTWSQDGSTDN